MPCFQGLLLLAALAAPLFAPTDAFASAAPNPRSVIAGLSVEANGSVRLVDERVIVDCQSDLFHCAVTLRYELSVDATTLTLTYPPRGTWVIWRVDGREASRSQSELTVQPSSGTVFVEASFEVTIPTDRFGYDIPGLQIRHLLLGQQVRERCGELAWRGSSIAHSEHYQGSIRLLTSPGDGVDVFGNITPDAQSPGEYTAVLGVTAPGDLPAEGSASLRQAPQLLNIGGPYIGLGSVDGRFIGGPHFAASVGFEFGLGEYVIGSGSLELDATGRLLTALSIEVATYSVLLVPSISLGVGLPIEWVAGTGQPSGIKAGFRLLAGLVFLSCIGVHGTLDYWPSYGEWVGGVSGRISL